MAISRKGEVMRTTVWKDDVGESVKENLYARAEIAAQGTLQPVILRVGASKLAFRCLSRR